MPSPRPDALSVGSSEATTTRLMPDSRMAAVHGGVRPVWAQGSSETYMVAPAGSSLHAARAMRSACGSPAPGVEALADHGVAADDDGAHQRVGRRVPTGPLRQLDGSPQVPEITLGGGGGGHSWCGLTRESTLPDGPRVGAVAAVRLSSCSSVARRVPLPHGQRRGGTARTAA